MQYMTTYESDIGRLYITADEDGLTGLFFENQKYFPDLGSASECHDHPVLVRTREWLDVYFDGWEPDFTPPLHPKGTEFQLQVWSLLCEIPYGETVTYGELAQRVAKMRGSARMSAQAVGGAVGHNKISIIIPCHRVVGSNGSLVGYAAGTDKKHYLLSHENDLLE